MALFFSEGVISHMSDIKTGTSERGTEWANMNIILDTPGFNGSYDKIQFRVGTDRIENVTQFAIGDSVKIGWSIKAREYNGKWYNNVELVTINSNIEESDQAPAQTAETAPARETRRTQKAAPLQFSNEEMNPESHEDDLPF